jgi:cellulose synthase/poly-beta-1,6-N-acetylglucosamine synthase-like glycosyltransferase
MSEQQRGVSLASSDVRPSVTVTTDLKMPTVSVIVPNYNHARFLARRIDSILKQSFQDFELILLDDCSTDDSRSILSLYARDPRVRIEFNEANSGGTFKQWNKGVRSRKVRVDRGIRRLRRRSFAREISSSAR